MKICLITNYASHYHLAKWQLMAETFDIDFVFDSDVSKAKGIKSMDLSQIRERVVNVSNFYFGDHMIWQSGVIKLAFKANYNKFIVIDEKTCFSSWILAAIIFFKKNKKFYWGDGHGWYGREGFFKRIIKKTAFLVSNGEFVYGNFSKKIMINNGLRADKIWVVHNSLNYSEQLQFRNNITNLYKDHFGNENPVLVFIGRLIKDKKLGLILSAMESLRAKGFECNCVLIGDGEMKNELIQETLRKKLEKDVWFFGACYSEEEISVLLTNADLCVSPGSIGLTAIHSMAYGTPVITHNNFPYQGPEFEAVIPDITGNFFEEDNVSSLSNVIFDWFSSFKNREEIRNNCYLEIDNGWTPEFKVNIFKKVLINTN